MKSVEKDRFFHINFFDFSYYIFSPSYLFFCRRTLSKKEKTQHRILPALCFGGYVTTVSDSSGDTVFYTSAARTA